MDFHDQDISRNSRCRRILDEIDEVADGASVLGTGDEVMDYAPAIIGVTESGSEPCVVYDYDSLIRCFMEKGMTYEEAVEWIDYNVLRSLPYQTRPPVIVRRLENAG